VQQSGMQQGQQGSAEQSVSSMSPGIGMPPPGNAGVFGTMPVNPLHAQAQGSLTVPVMGVPQPPAMPRIPLPPQPAQPPQGVMAQAPASQMNDDGQVPADDVTWINHARRAIAETRGDPHRQVQLLQHVRAQYLKQRFGRTVRTDEA